MQKLCNGCGEIKDLESSFPIKRYNLSGEARYSSRCKSCKGKAANEWRKKYRLEHPLPPRIRLNVEDIRARNRLTSIRQRQKIRETRIWLLAIKKTLSCVDCGLSFQDKPWLLDFHHRDPSLKSFELSNHANKSKEIILTEVAKCDALCANCHRTRHTLEQNSVYGLPPIVAQSDSPPFLVELDSPRT